jgi:hypothetical protein
LHYYPSEQRGDATLLIFKHVADDKLFWTIVAKHWSGFDAIDHEQFSAEFLKREAAWKIAYMSAKDRTRYRALPESFTIYRGQNRGDPVKNSWTFDRKVAEGFARGHRGMFNPSPVVLTANTTKPNIALLEHNREESEVVLFRPVGFKVNRSSAVS